MIRTYLIRLTAASILCAMIRRMAPEGSAGAAVSAGGALSSAAGAVVTTGATGAAVWAGAGDAPQPARSRRLKTVRRISVRFTVKPLFVLVLLF